MLKTVERYKTVVSRFMKIITWLLEIVPKCLVVSWLLYIYFYLINRGTLCSTSHSLVVSIFFIFIRRPYLYLSVIKWSLITEVSVGTCLLTGFYFKFIMIILLWKSGQMFQVVRKCSAVIACTFCLGISKIYEVVLKVSGVTSKICRELVVTLFYVIGPLISVPDWIPVCNCG